MNVSQRITQLRQDISRRVNLIACVMTTLAVLFLASFTVFLLYVPLMSAITVSAIVLGLIIMFGLGVQAAGGGIKIRRRVRSLTEPIPNHLTVRQTGA